MFSVDIELFGVNDSRNLFCCSSTVWNPCLYALLNEQFRLAYVDLLQYCRSGQKRCGTRYTDARCSRLVSNAFLANNSITEENIKLPNSVRRSKHGDYTAVSSSL